MIETHRRRHGIARVSVAQDSVGREHLVAPNVIGGCTHHCVVTGAIGRDAAVRQACRSHSAVCVGAGAFL